jgi:hypothetical protein
MRTVTLEVLRHGPAHGQLLSPFTPYLAICGPREAESLTISMEHRELLVKLHALYYKHEGATREFQIEDTAMVLGKLLGSIRGLVAELSQSGSQDLVHLRLVLSASELATLPFELARSEGGLPGGGRPLALQSDLRLAITREIRGVQSESPWPAQSRILFVAASPEEAGPVPIGLHAAALKRLVVPWCYYDLADPANPVPRTSEHLTILPNADVNQIAQALEEGNYTHVHVLAHGVPFSYAADERYGLALHHPKDQAKADIVDADRLAALLAVSRTPAVVTLATCQGGATGSVVGPGASLAHALHQSGIPLVVASQFPLTFTGSVVLVETLYDGLLTGSDPRELLHYLRHQLKARVPKSHDWASIVAYVALPAGIDAQLFRARLARLRQRLNAAMDLGDQAITLGDRAPKALFQDFLRRVDVVRQRAKAALDAVPPAAQRVELNGLLAGLEKREAQVRLRIARGQAGEAEKALRRSRNYYWEAYKADHATAWALVQYLVLDALLGNGRSRRFRHDQWAAARFLAERDLHSPDAETRVWALGSLIELHLLALLGKPSELIPMASKAKERARQYARDLNESSVVREIYTTRMQVIRYRDLFPRWFRNDAMRRLAAELIPILSKGISFRA